MQTLPHICLLGSGNVATHLAQALTQAGYPIAGIYSRTYEHACELANKLYTTPLLTDQVTHLPQADIYIFAVKDHVLPALAASLAQNPFIPAHALVIHTAGSMPLETLSQCFAHAAVLYPMQTFSKTTGISFNQVPLFVEGSTPEALEQVQQLASRLSRSVTPLSSEGRKHLHLAAVFACNFTNHCYTLAYSLLREAGIQPECLLPLIDETARKVHTTEPAAAQTGPAVRWDCNVMDEHLKALATHPQLQDIYRAMSQSIHQTSHD